MIKESICSVSQRLLNLQLAEIQDIPNKSGFVRIYKDNEGYLENEKPDATRLKMNPYGGAIRAAASNLIKTFNKNSVLMQYSTQEEAAKKEMQDFDQLSDLLKDCSSNSVS